jgi:hypothetical protein
MTYWDSVYCYTCVARLIPRASFLNFNRYITYFRAYVNIFNNIVWFQQILPKLLTMCCFETDIFGHTSLNRPSHLRQAFRIKLIGIHSAGLRALWSGVRVPVGAGNFSLHHRVQTGCGAHPASYPMDTRGSFPGGKAAGAWSWPLTSRMRGTIPGFPSTPSRHGVQLKAQGSIKYTTCIMLYLIFATLTDIEDIPCRVNLTANTKYALLKAFNSHVYWFIAIISEDFGVWVKKTFLTKQTSNTGGI